VTVTIRTRTVGQHFGTCGQLVTVGCRDRDRRVVAETDVVGYGASGVAWERALTLAVERGLTVLDSDGAVLVRNGVRP
jgi:hypothetical protein